MIFICNCNYCILVFLTTEYKNYLNILTILFMLLAKKEREKSEDFFFLQRLSLITLVSKG